ncbi:hypothetical protein Patl1_00847 [Pistacia atlantica]|uniref:Uncharacterized protein n=1 Tax=Pistacia atlantica TaxID=434234 RepID=A0ACC1C9Y5_9ROSI|nr:hypothetical protein Patl1_00847 [Pistacia atlantica]
MFVRRNMKHREDENYLVKSRLLDAMTKDIRSLFLRLATTKEIWEAAKRTYLVDQDASKVYQLHCQEIFVRLNEANHQDAVLGGKIGEGVVMAFRKMSTSKKDQKCTHCNDYKIFEAITAPMVVEMVVVAAMEMGKLYVVYVRREPDIYKSWDECKSQVQGVSNVVHYSIYSSYDVVVTFEAFIEERNRLEGGCGDMTYVKDMREKKCSDGLGMGSFSSSSTIIIALAERCEALEVEVQTVTQQRDTCDERAKMLEDALNDINKLKLGE